MDTTQEEKLEWTKYPFGAEANTPGVSFAIVAILDLLSFEGIDVSIHARDYFVVRSVSRAGSGEEGDKEDFGRKFSRKFPYGKCRGRNGHTAKKSADSGERYQKRFMVSMRAAYVGSRWPVRALSGAMFVFQLLSAQRAARQV